MNLESCVGIKGEEDIVQARQSGRVLAQQLGFDDVQQAQITTVISELASNIYLYAGQGTIYIESVQEESRVGLAIRACDHGPGIHDVQGVMEHGLANSNNMGAGLLGVRRIMDDFSISSEQGKGTDIQVIKWLQETEANKDAR